MQRHRCKASGCSGKVHTRGLCTLHYSRLQQSPEFMKVKTGPKPTPLLSKATIEHLRRVNGISSKRADWLRHKEKRNEARRARYAAQHPKKTSKAEQERRALRAAAPDVRKVVEKHGLAITRLCITRLNK